MSQNGFSYTFEREGDPQIGYSLDDGKKGDKIRRAQRGFFADYNGEIFFNILDSISDIYLKTWYIQGHFLSEIQNCLIFINIDNKIEVHLNNPVIAKILPKRLSNNCIKKGDLITSEDVAGILSISWEEIEINPKNAVIYVFSLGWRRGVYFDFLPLISDTYVIQDIEHDLGNCYTYLANPDVFRIFPKIKDKMYDLGWFPFIRLLGWRIKRLINAIRSETYDETVENLIIESFDRDSILMLVDKWMEKPIYKKSEGVIRKGIDRYLNDDFISAAHILYPRIDGIMQHVYSANHQQRPKTKELRETIIAIAKNKEEANSTFLLEFFEEYLQKFFFKNFDLSKGELDFSRPSIAHGVVEEENLTKKNVFIGILILDQLFFYI